MGQPVLRQKAPMSKHFQPARPRVQFRTVTGMTFRAEETVVEADLRFKAEELTELNQRGEYVE